MAVHDWVTSTFAAYALRPLDDARPEVVSEAKRRIVDSVGVAVGALGAPGPTAVRRYVQLSSPVGRSAVWGSAERSALEPAILANCAAVRYLDYNDAYFGEASGSHPSDMIPALIAVAEECRASGRALVESILIGYEVAVVAADGLGARRNGWDHVNLTMIGACAAAGRLMGLSHLQLCHALGIAVVSHMATGESRQGQLSMWKGLAAADAVRHAVYSCALAEAGVEGPQHPFLGDRGYVRLALGGVLADAEAVGGLQAMAPPERILQTHIKAWPIGVVSQSGVDAALRVSSSIEFADIERVEIETFKAAIDRNGSAEKFRPTTRETADHSLPFGVATALRDRRVDSASFDDENVRSPAMHRFLAERVHLHEDPALTAGYPDGFPTRISVHTRGGAAFVEEVTYPRGHAKNPLSDDELIAKYDTLTSAALGPESARELRRLIMAMDTAGDVGAIGRHLQSAAVET
jgi:2-methylcitrate dehydratase